MAEKRRIYRIMVESSKWSAANKGRAANNSGGANSQLAEASELVRQHYSVAAWCVKRAERPDVAARITPGMVPSEW